MPFCLASLSTESLGESSYCMAFIYFSCHFSLYCVMSCLYLTFKMFAFAEFNHAMEDSYTQRWEMDLENSECGTLKIKPAKPGASRN